MSQPIGFFDSGLGGLSVLHEAMLRLPQENFLFFADEDHVPYGTKPPANVKKYVGEAFDFLLSQEVKAIVVACNTATSVAVADMRRRYEIPIIGMEPAAKKALELNGQKRVLVAATPITVAGEKLQHLMERVDIEHLVDLLALPRLVKFAERGEFTSPQVANYLKAELAPFNLEEYSALVLGCTHFNYFKDTLKELLPTEVKFVDGNEGTVRELKRRLAEIDALCKEGESAPQRQVRYFYSGREVSAADELRRLEDLLARLGEMRGL
ncbi:MAG: glutamate racemase [Selenomonadaceae bacterium]|nr:glutamate racemase [Selenomonadaceae bacterium]